MDVLLLGTDANVFTALIDIPDMYSCQPQRSWLGEEKKGSLHQGAPLKRNLIIGSV
jgi:hypothetical protein